MLLSQRSGLRPRRFRPQVELLEDRAVPAVTITGAGAQVSAEGTTVSLDLHASSDVSTIENFGAGGLPAGLQAVRNGNTLHISGSIEYWIANVANPEVDHTVTVGAEDGTEDDAYITFNWKVTNVNRPPEITYYGAPDDWYGAEDESVFIPIQVTVPDDDSVTVTVTGLPPGLSYANGYITGTVQAHGEENPVKPYEVTIIASDGQDEDVASTFFQAIDFRVTNVTLSPPDGMEAPVILPQDHTPLTFTVTVSGVGAAITGQNFLWSVIEPDFFVDDHLWSEQSVRVLGTGPTRSWTRTLTFWLVKNQSNEVAGANESSGETYPDPIYVLIEKPSGIDMGHSNSLAVWAAPAP